MSDTNRVGLRYARSSTRVPPITLSPNEIRALRITGTPSLGFQPNTIVSNEIQPDRQVSDLILVGASAAGDIAFELSYGAFDDFIESALLSTWVNAPRSVGAGIVATGAGTIEVADASDYKIGHVVRLVDHDEGDPGDGVYVVTNIASDVLSVSPLDANTNAMTTSITTDAGTMLVVCGLIAASNGDLDIAVATGTLSVTAPAGFFDDAMGDGVDLAPGQWVKLSGFNLAANRVWGRIVTVDDDVITMAAPTGAASETTTGRGVVWFGDYLRNGSAAIASRQFAIERRFQDHSPVTRELFTGMSVNTMALNLEPQQIATGTFGMLGFNSSVSTTVTDLWNAEPTDIAAPAYDVYNTSSHVGRVGRGASQITAAGNNFAIGATIEVNNNMREQLAIGVLGAVGIGVGEFSVSGSLNAYFDDATLLNILLTGQDTSFDIAMQAQDGRSVLFDLPRIKFNSGVPQVPGKNQDVVIDTGYQAIRSPTLGYTMHVQRFHYSA